MNHLLGKLTRACGKHFFLLMGGGRRWTAFKDKDCVGFSGETPEDAVNKLRLKLNKNE